MQRTNTVEQLYTYFLISTVLCDTVGRTSPPASVNHLSVM